MEDVHSGRRSERGGKTDLLISTSKTRPHKNFLGDGEKGNPGRKLGAFPVQADGEIVKPRDPK